MLDARIITTAKQRIIQRQGAGHPRHDLHVIQALIERCNSWTGVVDKASAITFDLTALKGGTGRHDNIGVPAKIGPKQIGCCHKVQICRHFQQSGGLQVHTVVDAMGIDGTDGIGLALLPLPHQIHALGLGQHLRPQGEPC